MASVQLRTELFQREVHTDMGLPNQSAARNSRGRISFDTSDLLIGLFIFVAGAHPAMRELFR